MKLNNFQRNSLANINSLGAFMPFPARYLKEHA